MTQNLMIAQSASALAMVSLFVAWARHRTSTGTIVEGRRRFPVPNIDRFA